MPRPVKQWPKKSTFKGDNTFIIKDGARAGVTIPDYSYSYINNMLKNEVNISGAAYMGEERISTTAGKFDCTKISYLKRTKILLKTERCGLPNGMPKR